jgi:hypothetical protein
MAMKPVIQAGKTMMRKESDQTPTPADLQVLENYRCSEGLAVSVYLDLESLPNPDAANELLEEMAQAEKEKLGMDSETWASLREDLDIIRLYLKTNGNRNTPGVAIFCCAGEYFWRAYPLPTPVPTRMHIGPRLDTADLVLLTKAHERVPTG